MGTGAPPAILSSKVHTMAPLIEGKFGTIDTTLGVANIEGYISRHISREPRRASGLRYANFTLLTPSPAPMQDKQFLT